jgi:hypothetical protein
MKTFKVTAHYVVYLHTEIEANDENEAWEIAKNMDGSMFQDHEDDNWRIDDVYEVD